MSLSGGDRLGPYEIQSALGAGGMGEVYRARDTRLDRTVAIKVLPAELAADPERRMRFEREARAVAALSHPHICVVHDVGRENGIDYLVMELLEGETLAARLERAKGPLPLEQTLRIGREIADALDKAQRAGIVHRDLKPANVMLTKSGAKLLDFGLAKKREKVVAGSVEDASTRTGGPGTAAGTLLGTVHYMSPEQVEGREADARSDIWALGVVLYEMASGVRPFEGESAASLIGSILKDVPAPLRSRRPLTPASLDKLVAVALAKDPDERWQSAGDVGRFLQLAEIDSSAPASRSSTSGRQSAIQVALVLGTAALVTFGMMLWFRDRPSTTTLSAPLRMEVKAGTGVSLVGGLGPAVAISQDGSRLAFIARKSAQSRQLYVRRLDQLDATAMPGTEDATIPFFSPDGEWVGFFAGGKLKKVPFSGGPVVTICDAPTGRGGTWRDDGTIVFAPNSTVETTLVSVNANGGVSTPITSLSDGAVTHRWPQFLRAGSAVLYSTSTSIAAFNDGSIVVKTLPDGQPRTLIRGGYFGRYSHSGHLTYVHDGQLFAAPFDENSLELTGPPVRVFEHIAATPNIGAAQFEVSRSGVAVYFSEDASLAQPLEWLTRDGAIMPISPSMDWSNVRVSPDGTRVALDRSDGLQNDVWILDLARDTLSQLTFEKSDERAPLWTPDGGRIVYRSTRGQSAFHLSWQRSDGVGAAEDLRANRNGQAPAAWHPAGDVIALVENAPDTNYDILFLTVSQNGGIPSGQPMPFLKTKAQEVAPAFSPDGKWIAYVSNESGRNGVYVRPYPGPGGQRLVAAEGADPVWSRSRHELVYLGPDQRLMVASYSIDGDSFRVDATNPWASARAVIRPRGLSGLDGRSFDLHPDGRRAIGTFIPETAPLPAQDSVVLAFDFFDELKRLSQPGASEQSRRPQ